MRVLVMGGTQFNGLALVHELAQTGHDVVILNRGQSQADLPLGVERVYADRTDQEQMRDALGSIDAFSMVMGARNILPDREQRMFQRMLQNRPILIPGNGRMLQQVGRADDQARALCMLLGQPSSFGERYNLTGADFFSQEGYVDTFARIVDRESEKVFIPPSLMEDLWQGRLELQLPEAQAKVDIRAKARISRVMINRFMLSMLVQQIAPHIHHWDRSALFGIDKLRRDSGWEPELSFPRAVERTWHWYRSEGLPETQHFDFGFEDALIRLVHDRKD